MGVTLRRKNGPAPLRNRIRRQIREVVRLERHRLEAAWLWWSFPPARLKTPTRELRAAAIQALERSGLLRP